MPNNLLTVPNRAVLSLSSLTKLDYALRKKFFEINFLEKLPLNVLQNILSYLEFDNLQLIINLKNTSQMMQWIVLHALQPLALVQKRAFIKFLTHAHPLAYFKSGKEYLVMTLNQEGQIHIWDMNAASNRPQPYLIQDKGYSSRFEQIFWAEDEEKKWVRAIATNHQVYYFNIELKLQQLITGVLNQHYFHYSGHYQQHANARYRENGHIWILGTPFAVIPKKDQPSQLYIKVAPEHTQDIHVWMDDIQVLQGSKVIVSHVKALPGLILDQAGEMQYILVDKASDELLWRLGLLGCTLSPIPCALPPIKDAGVIRAGTGVMVCALTQDNQVLAWNTGVQQAPVRLDVPPVVRIFTMLESALLLSEDGSVYVFDGASCPYRLHVSHHKKILNIMTQPESALLLNELGEVYLINAEAAVVNQSGQLFSQAPANPKQPKHYFNLFTSRKTRFLEFTQELQSLPAPESLRRASMLDLD